MRYKTKVNHKLSIVILLKGTKLIKFTKPQYIIYLVAYVELLAG